MPEGASVFSSKPVLPVNEGNSTNNQTQSLISSSYSEAMHSSKVGDTQGKAPKDHRKIATFREKILNMNITTVLKT